MDRWLEALQKARHATPASAKPELNVDPMFSDLCKISSSSDDDDVAVMLSGQVYDSDVPTCDVFDPVAAVFEKAQKNKFNISEFAPPHEDGIFFEKCGSATWSYTYQGGVLVTSTCDDPELPSGRLVFDEHGNEVRKRELDFGIPIVNNPARHILQGSPRLGPDVQPDLELITDSLDELLGSSAYPERKPEVPADSKKKTAASETYMVDGKPLAKSELTSRMYRVVEQIRDFCQGGEAALLEKAIKALDLTAFAELAEPVLVRMRRATELIRSH